MLRSKVAYALALVMVMAIGQAFSQESQPAGARGQRNRDQARQTPGQFREQAAERMKEALEVSDVEWQALQPKIEKVQTLAFQTRSGMGGMMMRGGRGGPGGEQAAGATAGAEIQQTDVERKAAALRKLLDDKDSKPEAIKAALTAYRDALAKAKAELAQAQKELKELLNVRQEAQLVIRGLLD